jgi:hypothetical protein
MAFEKSVVIDSKSMAQSEWKQMPEFVQERQKPFAQIIFRFETEQDLNDFAEIVGQKLTSKTKSSWHPFRPHRDPNRRVYK